MISFVVWLLLACVTGASKFRVMEKSVPRSDFVQKGPALSHELHTLVFAVKQNNLPELDQILIERSTPGNELYQQWLTFDEITELTQNKLGASEVQTWLHSNHINITWMSIRQDYIKAEALISTWESLLNTKFHVWEDLSRTSASVNKARTMHRAKQYSLPEHLTAHISAVFNTVQVPPVFAPRYYTRDGDQAPEFKTNLRINKIDPVPNHANHNSENPNNHNNNKHTSALDGKVTVSFLNELYEITSNTGLATQSQSVFQTAEESYSPTDLSLFQSYYNLPQQEALHPFGFNTTQCTGSTSCYEGNLDVQYIMGVAQQTATIYWYVSDVTNSDPFVAWVTDVANTPNPPLVNSMSWGSLEQANSEDVLIAFNTEALKLSAMGVTVTVATGDNGAAAGSAYCNIRSGSGDYGFWKGPTSWTGRGYFPSFPATSPYVTAVGATMGPESGNPEVACQSQLGGLITSGGGFSTYNPTPSWQQSAVSAYFGNLTTAQTPTSGYNPRGRGIPDVSMIGVAYQVFLQGQFISLYGTSAASPVFAALVSLANAARAAENKPSLGFLNPTLYARGTDAGTKTLFKDITSGHSKCMVYGTTCCNSGFFATNGWDPVTGLGTITLPNLMSVFMNGSVSLAPTALPTRTPTRKPSVTPSARPTRVPTRIPTTKPTATPTTVPSVNPTELPSQEPTAEPTAVPTSPSAIPTVVLTVSPSADPTVSPSLAPSVVPSIVPTVIATVQPTMQPTAQPSEAPSLSPTVFPSSLPTQEPSGPSYIPTQQPQVPTAVPTEIPSVVPTMQPTLEPTLEPSLEPTFQPSVLPTVAPTTLPTLVPTLAPTLAPTLEPTLVSTLAPTLEPALVPTLAPTFIPTVLPTVLPTIEPTLVPTVLPTVLPTVVPSTNPSVVPTPAPTRLSTSGPSSAASSKPSMLPTAMTTSVPSVRVITPTMQPSVRSVLSFTTTVTLAGVEDSQLSSEAQLVLVQATASVLLIDPTAVTYVGAKAVAESTSRRTFRARSTLAQNVRTNKARVLTTYTLDATTRIELALSDTTYSNTQELYTVLSLSLQDSVGSGNFTATLRTFAATLGASELSSASATRASTSDPVTTTSSTNSKQSELSTGEISAIAVAGFACIILLVFAGACICGRSSASVCSYSGSGSGSGTTAAVSAVEVRLPEETLVEATAVRIENTHSQDEIPFPECHDVYVVESNPQLAVVI